MSLKPLEMSRKTDTPTLPEAGPAARGGAVKALQQGRDIRSRKLEKCPVFRDFSLPALR
jgi:hypothetical protein